MQTVLVTGLILTPLCATAMLIADGPGVLRRPLDLGGKADAVSVARLGRGWRAWYRLDQIQRLLWRLGLAAGLVCLGIAGVGALLHV